MAKRMLLIPKPTLIAMHSDWKRGVPVRRLLSSHSLSMSPPTLARLIKTYDLLEQHEPMTLDYNLIYNSLFAPWLSLEQTEQPPQYKYNGEWPKGTWSITK